MRRHDFKCCLRLKSTTQRSMHYRQHSLPPHAAPKCHFLCLLPNNATSENHAPDEHPVRAVPVSSQTSRERKKLNPLVLYLLSRLHNHVFDLQILMTALARLYIHTIWKMDRHYYPLPSCTPSISRPHLPLSLRRYFQSRLT